MSLVICHCAAVHGQSNMELTVSQAFNSSAEIARAGDYPLLRLFTVGQEYVDGQREYRQLRSVWQDWSVSSPHAVGAGNWTVFSAACNFFGRALQEKLQVPVRNAPSLMFGVCVCSFVASLSG
jgi:hypothetical protein